MTFQPIEVDERVGELTNGERVRISGFQGLLKKPMAALLAGTSVSALVLMGGTAGAASADTAAQTWWIDSCGMPTQSKGGPAKSVKVRAWTKPGNKKTVVMLDGLRATNDVSGWEHNTKVGPELAAKGVNVVQPVGGYMSYYSDWNTPDNFSNQGYTYKWDCVITKSLVEAMDKKKLRGPSGKYAIMGLSMSGSSALIIAGNNKNNFDAAASMSGYLNLSAPGMREAIRASMIAPMLDGGTPAMNSDAMWGPPWSTRWLDNDPFVQIHKLDGLKKLFISTGSGIPGYTATPEAILRNPALIVQGAPLEIAASALTHAFDLQAAVNQVPHTTYFPAQGLHDWPYWNDAVWSAYRQGFFNV